MSLKVWESKDQLSSSDLNANFDAVINLAVDNEDLSGYVSPPTNTFTTANRFKPGTLKVYLSDGASGEMFRKQRGTSPANGDYVEILDGNGNGQSFQFNSVVPALTSKLVVDYQKALP